MRPRYLEVPATMPPSMKLDELFSNFVVKGKHISELAAKVSPLLVP